MSDIFTTDHLLPLDAPTHARAFASEAHRAGLIVSATSVAGDWLVCASSQPGDPFLLIESYLPPGGSSQNHLNGSRVSLGEVRAKLQERISERKVDNSPRWLGTEDGERVDINGVCV